MKVITDIKGGLGNQMFCYAFGYAVSKETGADLYLDTSMLDQSFVNNRKMELDNYELRCKGRISYRYRDDVFHRKTGLNRIRKKLAIGIGTKEYKEGENRIFEKEVFDIKTDTFFDGFWQNYRYFDKYRNELLNIFRPKQTIAESVKNLQSRLEAAESVSLHIRRGDYIGLNWQISMKYYEEAIERITKEIGNNNNSKITLCVFSDDMDFVKGFFSKREVPDIDIIYAEYESENNNIYDMYLMSRCRHNIIANSSYSWWGAYLNNNPDKKVICPVVGVWNENIYPEEWIKLAAETEG